MASFDADKAELLNSFLCSQSTLGDGNHPTTTMHNHHNLSEIFFSTTDVRDAISPVDPSKASRPDKVSPRIVNEGPEERVVHYVDVKKYYPSKPFNYRPLALRNCR